jgi:hypothetical protein
MFDSWKNAPRTPAVHHNAGLPLLGELRANNGVLVSYGRDGEYLHVLWFNGRPLDRTLAPGAPTSALVEKIKEGEELADAVHRLANRASRYAVRENSFSRKITYRDVPV